STAIDPTVVDGDGVYRKTGPARVFTRERDAIAAIKSTGPGRVRPGDVLVLICRGPLGAGMEEIYQITAALKHLTWGNDVAVVTGRAPVASTCRGARRGRGRPTRGSRASPRAPASATWAPRPSGGGPSAASSRVTSCASWGTGTASRAAWIWSATASRSSAPR